MCQIRKSQQFYNTQCYRYLTFKECDWSLLKTDKKWSICCCYLLTFAFFIIDISGLWLILFMYFSVVLCITQIHR